MSKKSLGRLFHVSSGLGIFPFSPKLLMAWPWYFSDRRKFMEQLSKIGDDSKIYYYPILTGKNAKSGYLPKQYFIQDLYVASKIFKRCPNKHVDVGSRIDGFVAHVASFRSLEVFDIRPQNCIIENVTFLQADISIPSLQYYNYCDSLSCLHTLEHIGLGRYGDTVDVNGHVSALENLANYLQKNGILYLSAPIGKPRIEFNAHRIFSVSYLISLISKYFDILQFNYINDDEVFHEGVSLEDPDLKNNFGCCDGLAIFELSKR